MAVPALPNMRTGTYIKVPKTSSEHVRGPMIASLRIPPVEIEPGSVGDLPTKKIVAFCSPCSPPPSYKGSFVYRRTSRCLVLPRARSPAPVAAVYVFLCFFSLLPAATWTPPLFWFCIFWSVKASSSRWVTRWAVWIHSVCQSMLLD